MLKIGMQHLFVFAILLLLVIYSSIKHFECTSNEPVRFKCLKQMCMVMICAPPEGNVC